MVVIANSDVAVLEPGSAALIHRHPFWKRFILQWDLQLLVVPCIIYIIVFNYIPMYGVLMAFQDYQLGDIMGFSEWVGFTHFRTLFNDPYFMRLLRNNLIMGVLRIVIGFPLPIIFALMLNELRLLRFKKLTQTISYLPNFVAWAVAAVLMFDFLSTDNGAVNDLLMALGIIDTPINFFGDSQYFYGIFIGTHVWKQLGWDAIIFIAAITAVDAELYEAASIDGAGRLQKIWHITLGCIKPTIVILFILTIGGLMNTSFDQVMMLTRMGANSLIRETSDILQTYVFRVGIRDMRYSYASAVGLLVTLINFVLLLGANWIARRTNETSLF